MFLPFLYKETNQVIKVKFKVHKDEEDNFTDIVNEVLDALRDKKEVVMHEFTVVPVQVSLEVDAGVPVLTVEGYIK